MHSYITKSGFYLFAIMLIILQGCTLPPDEAEMQALVKTQSSLLKQQQTELLSSDKDRTNLYFLGISTDYQQNEMFRETLEAQSVFDKYLDTKDRSALLINHLDSIETTPMVTHSNIRRSLKNIAGKMDLEEDILFVYLTAHGNDNYLSGGEIKINFGPEQDAMLNARSLNRYLDAANIKWKVIIVNACQSGSFIEDLIDPYTLVITSTDAERFSYYSPDPVNNYSFFARSFFENIRADKTSLNNAFQHTVTKTSAIESGYGISSQERSRPQFVYGDEILDKLKEVEMN